MDKVFFAAQFIAAFFKKGWHFIDSACVCNGEKDGHSLKNTVHCTMAAINGEGDFSILFVNPTDTPVAYELAFEKIERQKIMAYVLSDDGPFEKISVFSENTITVSPFSITVLSTLDVTAPCYPASASEVLALPYSDDFRYGTGRSVPCHTTDQGGAFELQNIGGETVLMQMITPETKAMEWGATPESTTCFGDDRWYSYRFKAVCRLAKSDMPDRNYVGIGTRYFLACMGMSGYSLRLYENGKWKFYRNSEILSEGDHGVMPGDFTLEICCGKEDVSAFINGNRILFYRENIPERPGLPAGRAALYSSYNKNAFREVSVEPIGEAAYITRFDDTDACFSYSGIWENNIMSAYADYRRTVSVGGAGSSFSVAFTGTEIALFGCTESCLINAYLDGKLFAENVRINQCGNREVFYKICGLEPLAHAFSAKIISGILKIDGAQIVGGNKK